MRVVRDVQVVADDSIALVCGSGVCVSFFGYRGGIPVDDQTSDQTYPLPYPRPLRSHRSIYPHGEPRMLPSRPTIAIFPNTFRRRTLCWTLLCVVFGEVLV